MGKYLKKIVVALLTLVALALGCATHQDAEQAKNEASSQVFGIPIRKGTIDLIQKVESLYQKPLCVTSFQEKEKCGTLTEEYSIDFFGVASVSLEGAPVVLLDETGRNETTLVHELFHLKLTAEGYPTFESHIDKALKPDPIKHVMLIVSNSLEHRVFYPEMRTMGLDPDRLVRAELENLMSGDTAS